MKKCNKISKFLQKWEPNENNQKGGSLYVERCINISEIGNNYRSIIITSGGSKRGRGVQILSISCSFLGKFGKIVCWRPLGELASPPRGNPGSAIDNCK